MNNKLSRNISKNVAIKGKDAISKDDLVLLIICLTNSDSEKLEKKHQEIKNTKNITYSYLHIDYARSDIFEAYLYSQNPFLVVLPPETKYFYKNSLKKLRIDANITTHILYLSLENYISLPWSQIFFLSIADLNMVVANELINIFPRTDGALKQMTGNGLWYWDKTKFYKKSQYPSSEIIHEIFLKLWILIKSFISFGVLSLITAFVFRIGLMASSIFLFICSIFLTFSLYNLVDACRCCIQENRVNQQIAYRAMPWLGMHASNLRRTNRSNTFLHLAFLYFLLITYMFYGECYAVWANMFSGYFSTLSIDSQGYYPYVEFLELSMLVFIRSRISIKYFPKIMTILNVLYLFYCYTGLFPYAFLAILLLSSASLVVFLLFLKYFELPMTEANPFAFHTPSANNPRQAYMHTLHSRFSLGFDLWSIFYIPSFRSEFTPDEQTEIGTEAEPTQFNFSGIDENQVPRLDPRQIRVDNNQADDLQAH